ncbi:PilN domain-containing protein [Agaribacter marinus]|uniref:Pilus assembly protein PilN n=1 Tax=Agaribacter marinus TaxID=1431249 RepID=A0AA37WJJ8_9ALTE|nr:PilN domain-containing protein [Agaribacter marinus]GLR72318.1 pilus assembly protein PilN [Agaribacter marinus]
MAQINLLPWRESLRQTQKKQYIISLGLVAVSIFVLFWLAGQFIEQQIRNQKSRNNYLTQQIQVLDTQIAEIKTIKDKKDEIALRMSLIEQLQVSRNLAPILFEELANTVPPGISFNTLSRSGNNIKIVGVSESNNRLSDFMRALDESKVFVEAELSSIVADASAANAISDFELSMKVSAAFAPVAIETTTEASGR